MILKQAIKKLLAMGLPMAAGRFMHTFATFMVMLFLAQLGHDVLAASFSIAVIRIVILVIFMSPLFAIGAIVGRTLIGDDTRQAQHNDFIQQASLAALILSVIAICSGMMISPLLHLLHQPPQLIPIISTYFDYYVWAIPMIYLSTAMQQYLVGIKKQLLMLCVNITSMLLSISLNYCLIFGKLGFSALGVSGAGIASIISASIGFLLSLILVCCYSKVSIKPVAMKSLNWLKKIFSLGLPISIRTASDLLLMFALMIMTGWLGEIAMSASQISNEYLMLALLPLFGLGEASAVVLGHTLKEKSKPSLLALNHAAIILATSFSLIVGGIFALFHQPFTDAFIDFNSHDATSIYKLALILLAMRIGKMFINGPVVTYTGLLRGFFDTKYPMQIGVLLSWGVTLPLAYYFAMGLNMGVVGIILAAIIAETLLLIALYRRWCSHLAKVDF